MLSTEKTVLIPDLAAGSSLAADITGADVRLLRERYPGVPVVTYVNTSVEVTAESDICCASSRAGEVVEERRREREMNSKLTAMNDRFETRHDKMEAKIEKLEAKLIGRSKKNRLNYYVKLTTNINITYGTQ